MNKKDNISEFIIKQCQQLNYSSQKNQNIGILALYNTLQHNYFNGHYKFLNLFKNNKGDFLLAHDKLNYVPLATNQKAHPSFFYYQKQPNKNTILKQQVIDNIQLFEFDSLEEEQSFEQHFSGSAYYSQEKYDILKEYQNILDNSSKIQDLIDPYIDLIQKNHHALPIISSIDVETMNSTKTPDSIAHMIQKIINYLNKNGLKQDKLKQISIYNPNNNDYNYSINDPCYKIKNQLDLFNSDFVFEQTGFLNRNNSINTQSISRFIHDFYASKNSGQNRFKEIFNQWNRKYNKGQNNGFLKSMESYDLAIKHQCNTTSEITYILFGTDFYNTSNQQKIETIKEMSVQQLIDKAHKTAKTKNTIFSYLIKNKTLLDFYCNIYNDQLYEEKKQNAINHIQPYIENSSAETVISNHPNYDSIKAITQQAENYFGLSKEQSLSITHETNDVDQTIDTYQNMANNKTIIQNHCYSCFSLEENQLDKKILNEININETNENHTHNIANIPGFIASIDNTNETIANAFFMDFNQKQSGDFNSNVNFPHYNFHFLSTREYFQNKGYGKKLFFDCVEHCISNQSNVIMGMNIDDDNSYSIDKMFFEAQKAYQHKALILNMTHNNNDFFELDPMLKNLEYYGMDHNTTIEDLVFNHYFWSNEKRFNQFFINASYSGRLQNANLADQIECYNSIKQLFKKRFIQNNHEFFEQFKANNSYHNLKDIQNIDGFVNILEEQKKKNRK